MVEESAAPSLIDSLMERAKELSTLYRIEELVSDQQLGLDEVLQGVAEAMPLGWQYPRVARAEIVYQERSYRSDGFAESPWSQAAPIVVREQVVGQVRILYTQETPPADEGPFLKEEVQLLKTISSRVAQRVLHEALKGVFETRDGADPGGGGAEWHVAVGVLRKIDEALLVAISRKMMNLLLLRGVEQAAPLLQRFGEELGAESAFGEANEPRRKASLERLHRLCDETFAVAARHLPEAEILGSIQRWLNEDKAMFLNRVVSDTQSSVHALADAVERYLSLAPEGVVLPPAAETGVRVELIRRMLGEQLDFIKVAKGYLELKDFAGVLRRVVSASGSEGRVGGKSSGLLLASRILEKARESCPEIGDFRVPRAWYVASDGLLRFLSYNNLDDLYEHKYKDIEEIRQEYPHIVQVFKHSHFPPEIVKGLATALDELGDVPLVVRSSSLLEDRLGHPFPGKYRSLFVANQGLSLIHI